MKNQINFFLSSFAREILAAAPQTRIADPVPYKERDEMRRKTNTNVKSESEMEGKRERGKKNF